MTHSYWHRSSAFPHCPRWTGLLIERRRLLAILGRQWLVVVYGRRCAPYADWAAVLQARRVHETAAAQLQRQRQAARTPRDTTLVRRRGPPQVESVAVQKLKLIV